MKKNITTWALAASILLSAASCPVAAEEMNANTIEQIDFEEDTSSTPTATPTPATSIPVYRFGDTQTITHEEGLDIGCIVKYGACEQDGDTKNGKEPIEWIILDKNNEESKTLLLSLKALGLCEMNGGNETCTWNDSTAMYYLNFKEEGGVLYDAFSEEEQTSILHTTVKNSTNQLYNVSNGKDGTYQVFLLSFEEVMKYLPWIDRKCEPTAEAINTLKLVCGENAEKDYLLNGYCSWWLRTPGKDFLSFLTVAPNGLVLFSGTNLSSTSVFVRPAMWVDNAELEAKLSNPSVSPTSTPTPSPEPTKAKKEFDYSGWVKKKFKHTSGYKILHALKADVTQDGIPEIIIIEKNDSQYIGQIFKVDNGKVTRIYKNEGCVAHAGGFYGFYLKPGKYKGYHLVKEEFGMWQGLGTTSVKEFYLTSKGKEKVVKKYSVSSKNGQPVSEKEFNKYVKKISPVIKKSILIGHDYTESTSKPKSIPKDIKIKYK